MAPPRRAAREHRPTPSSAVWPLPPGCRAPPPRRTGARPVPGRVGVVPRPIRETGLRRHGQLTATEASEAIRSEQDGNELNRADSRTRRRGFEPEHLSALLCQREPGEVVARKLGRVRRHPGSNPGAAWTGDWTTEHHGRPALVQQLRILAPIVEQLAVRTGAPAGNHGLEQDGMAQLVRRLGVRGLRGWSGAATGDRERDGNRDRRPPHAVGFFLRGARSSWPARSGHS